MAWMPTALLTTMLVASLALAGCTSEDGGTGTDAGAAGAATYRVPVEGGHALSSGERTITLKVSQGGQEIGSGTYRAIAFSPKDQFATLFTVTATGGPLELQAFEGSNPQGFKTINPATCADPNFQVHVVDGAIHLWSNCD